LKSKVLPPLYYYLCGRDPAHGGDKSQFPIKSQIRSTSKFFLQNHNFLAWDLELYCLPASARLWQAGKFELGIWDFY